MNNFENSFSGKLGDGRFFPDLLRLIYLRKMSGELLMERKELKKKLFFSVGVVKYCATNVSTERFGSALVRDGKISQDDLLKALKKKGPDRRLGAELVERGLITQEELKEKLFETARENIYEIFNWSEGKYSFNAQGTSLPDDLEFNLPIADIILEGVRRIKDFNVVEQGLGDIRQPLVAVAQSAIGVQLKSLTTLEGFLYSRVEGHLSVEEICAIRTVDRRETCRCLYGLLCVGLIEHTEYTADKQEGDWKKRETGQHRQPGETREELRKNDEPVSAEVTADSGTFLSTAQADVLDDMPPAGYQDFPDVAGEQTESGFVDGEARERDVILEKYESCCELEADYYTVLEIPWDAESQQIRQAYYRMAKLFHPDRHHRPNLQDLRDTLEVLFMKIGEAYEVLRDSARREEYDRRQIRQPAPGSVMGRGGEPEAKQMAEAHFQDGLRFYREKDYWNAVQLFRQAVSCDTRSSEYFRYLGLALSQNPKWSKEAEKNFQRAIELEPYNADLQILLGRLYRNSGLIHRAQTRFEEALRIDPGQETAHRELQDLLLDMKKEKKTFLKDLFRKKT